MDTYVIIKSLPCLVCKTVKEYTVTEKQREAYHKGRPVSKVFPSFSVMELESLISGVCSEECWDKLFDDDQLDEGE